MARELNIPEGTAKSRLRGRLATLADHLTPKASSSTRAKEEMGAKTALLAFADGDIPSALVEPEQAPRDEVEAFIQRVFPGDQIKPDEDSTLFDDVYPPYEGLAYATIVDGVKLVCHRSLVLSCPSELPEHLLALGAGRRTVMHGMHSVVDWLCFAVWEDGRLVRSLSLAPDSGVLEDIGEPFDFERPYWAGEHPVPSEPDEEPYPLPFHPLELGEEALRALFGFVIEGEPEDDDIDPEAVELYGFRVLETA